MTRSAEFEDKFRTLPQSPGVYLYKNIDGKIIYVGKSKCLKNRVSSYFQSSNLNIKTRKLVSNIYDFDIIVTASEAEALILENELIKRHNPKYNIKLKDAKTYPYIKIVPNSGYPILALAHKRSDNKSKYFGPYTSASAAKDIIKTIQKTFRIPDCDKHFNFCKQICRPCLNYHLDQCVAPCTGKISPDEYNEIFKDIEYFLKGDYKAAQASLEEKMNKAAEELRFESAAKYRDSINNLTRLSQKQTIVSTPKNEQDVFGFYESETISCIAVLLVRNGVIQDKNTIFLSPDEICDTEAINDLILRYYDNFDMIPRTIFTSFDLSEDGEKDLSETLSSLSGHSVNVHHPEKGDNRRLCEMADENAKEASITRNSVNEHDEKLLFKVAQLLHLECLPERIESYDISNSGKTDMYAGMIVLENGRFKKSDYRSFSIKTTDGQDDYAAMREALERRISHIGKDDDSSMNICPDLILLDGGVGHVSTILSLFAENNIHIPLFGMVKDDYHKTRTLTDGVNEISIAKDQSVFSFFYRIQEEVHRFTFAKMDSSRRKKVKTSSLTEINGIGEAKAKLLMSRFKTLSAIKNATLEELTSVSGINEDIAGKIIQHYNTGDKK